jgi:hypothetical protein
MEKLIKYDNGQWSLEKADFSLAESKKAYDPNLTPVEHQERIKMHDHAAAIHAQQGNKDSSAWHRQQAQQHYQALIGKAPATPTHIIKEELDKKAPKGIDPDKHERCVMDVKEQGYDVGSAHAICTSSMKKDEVDKIKQKYAESKEPSIGEKIKQIKDSKSKELTFDEQVAAIKAKYAESKEPSIGEKIKQIKDSKSKELTFDEQVAAIKAKYAEPKEPSIGEKTKQIKDSKSKELTFDEQVAAIKAKYKGKLTKFNAAANAGSSLMMTEEEVEKSGYGPKGAGLYNPVDNIKRKKNRTGEVHEDVGQNKAVHQYAPTPAGSAKQQADAESKKYKKLNQKQPVKIYTPEEKAALQAKMQKTMAVEYGLQPSSDQWLAAAAQQLGLPTDPKVAEALAKQRDAKWENAMNDCFQKLMAPIGDTKSDIVKTRGPVNQNDESELTEEEQRIRAISVNPDLFKD